MKEVVLDAREISKIYGLDTKNPVYALNKVSLKIEAGEFVCIMGPSGSGKSTLINNLTTIDVPTTGNVYIGGIEVKQMSQKEIGKFRYKNLGFVFQNYNLLNSLTLFENITLPLNLASMDKDTIVHRIEMWAKKLGIMDILEKYPSDCSGGQNQRAAVCRALVSEPKLLIADEPTGNLDSKNSHELLSLFKKLNETNHVSIVMVTHDAMIASYSSKLLYLKDGVIDQVLERQEMSQKEYFDQIVAINSSASLALFNGNKKE